MVKLFAMVNISKVKTNVSEVHRARDESLHYDIRGSSDSTRYLPTEGVPSDFRRYDFRRSCTLWQPLASAGDTLSSTVSSHRARVKENRARDELFAECSKICELRVTQAASLRR